MQILYVKCIAVNSYFLKYTESNIYIDIRLKMYLFNVY